MNLRDSFENYAKKQHNLSDGVIGRYIQDSENMTRSVIEERTRPFREIDVFSRLIEERIIYLGAAVTSEVANLIGAQLLFLDSVNPKKKITLYINSPGGSIYAGLGIYDTMQYVQAPISTICVGLAASMGAVLLAAGAKGERASLPHSRIMIHQPLTSMDGKGYVQMSDMEISVKQLMGLGEDLYKILAHHTEKPLETIRKDANRDFWLRADEAKAYGLIDHVLTKS